LNYHPEMRKVGTPQSCDSNTDEDNNSLLGGKKTLQNSEMPIHMHTVRGGETESEMTIKPRIDK
jgi:hypothetical protein